MITRLYKKAVEHKWEIGFIENSFDGILNGEELNVRWVKNPYCDRWFADPFILDVKDDYIELLVEEFSYELKKGRIARLTIVKDTMELVEMKIILEKPTHLSFPAIIRNKEGVFIYPENHQSGNLILYKYDRKTDTCNECSILCKEPLTDAVTTTFFGEEMIFSTRLPSQNGNVLGIYKREGDYFVKYKDITFEENIGRMAGDFVEYRGHIYRPAQESNRFYGHSLSIQEVTENIEFSEIRRLLSPHNTLKLGMHTLNMYKGCIVIDVKGFRYPRIGNFLFNLRHHIL